MRSPRPADDPRWSTCSPNMKPHCRRHLQRCLLWMFTWYDTGKRSRGTANPSATRPVPGGDGSDLGLAALKAKRETFWSRCVIRGISPSAQRSAQNDTTKAGNRGDDRPPLSREHSFSGSASIDASEIFDHYEQELFTSVVALAEREGKLFTCWLSRRAMCLRHYDDGGRASNPVVWFAVSPTS